jgi:hypothetical protein
VGCRHPAPAGFTSGEDENVWLKAGSANMATSESDRIIAWVTPLLEDHESVGIFNRMDFQT